ncbi:MAG: hypothetical protein EHM21_18015, partial [Chloroflexi bacterium]
CLPEQTAQLLVERYIHESAPAEIAEKMGLKTGAVAVRLQRARLSLRRLLRTHLQAEAQAFGLLPLESSAWEETRIWCPTCGQGRLLGLYHKAPPDPRFALRCPHCHPDLETIMAGVDLALPYYASLLGSVKTYRPAYNRLLTGLAAFYSQALQTRSAGCLACGRPVVIHVTRQAERPRSPVQEPIGIRIHCSACDWATNTSLRGLVMALPEAQRFWRENPRMRAHPAQEIEFQGAPAYITRLESLPGAAEMAVISRRDTLAPVSVQANVPL